jgi:hypothetical protein
MAESSANGDRAVEAGKPMVVDADVATSVGDWVMNNEEGGVPGGRAFFASILERVTACLVIFRFFFDGCLCPVIVVKEQL